MDLAALLLEDEPAVIDDAYSVLGRSLSTHYAAAGEQFTRARLEDLFHLVVDAVQTRNLIPVSQYSQAIATERFGQGFDISEVQSAFNALEEALWRRLISNVPAEDLPEAIGLLSTVLGFGKDTLARTYVSLASARQVPSLDLSAMFEGTASRGLPS
jgi:hypothetical protein